MKIFAEVSSILSQFTRLTTGRTDGHFGHVYWLIPPWTYCERKKTRKHCAIHCTQHCSYDCVVYPHHTHRCVDIARRWQRRRGSHDTRRTSRGLWRHRQTVDRPTPCCSAASNTASINWFRPTTKYTVLRVFPAAIRDCTNNYTQLTVSIIVGYTTNV